MTVWREFPGHKEKEKEAVISRSRCSPFYHREPHDARRAGLSTSYSGTHIQAPITRDDNDPINGD